ncbi:MAG: hypothetical protein Q8M94_20390, partial [Ignavibacteria bacterium]|nr:hypothetical protein [Ignavibacteria bacterium]
MELFELEHKYSELKNFLSEHFSKRTKLLKISDFFTVLLTLKNQNLIESYLSEFIHPYFALIKVLEVRGSNPNRLRQLINQLKLLSNLNFIQIYKDELDEALLILHTKFNQSAAWLTGNVEKVNKNIIYFPVLEKFESGNEIGYLETIYVEIKSGENKFHITPAEAQNDVQLEKQLEICWNIALKFCSTFVKRIKPKHTVDLHFENRLGVYVGHSLGIALTLAFIEAILKHYNSPTVIRVNGAIAVTGGID